MSASAAPKQSSKSDSMLGRSGVRSPTLAPEGGTDVQYMMLRQRVLQEMDRAGYTSILIMLDVFFSCLSVVLYIVMTYNLAVQPLYIADLTLTCVFSLNWLLWLWLAEDRLHYIFSFMSLVDAVTIIPAFVLYALEGAANIALPGLNFLRVLRILRVVRVFRMKHVMQRHMEGAVTEALAKLVFTLLCMLLIAAGLFYELEKYAPKPNEDYAHLMFHEALYWAAVTLTTVGYGDLAPTYWATQMMLIALLLITFTLLPYLTNQLMDALGSSNSYQRARFRGFSRRSDTQHLVFLGAVDDGPTMQGILDELYHEDKGVNLMHTVFLAPSPPTLDVQHLLAAHHACSKLTYLQGSPFRTEDLHRAYAEYASAVFMVAPKHAEEPLLADRHTVMMTLSLGQYLQEANVRLRDKLEYLPNKMAQWFRIGRTAPPESLPSVYVQMVLPEGRLRLHQIMESLSQQQKPSSTVESSTANGSAGATPYTAANTVAAAAAAAAARHAKTAGTPAAGGRDVRMEAHPFSADAKAALDALAGNITANAGSSHGSEAAFMHQAGSSSGQDGAAARSGSSSSGKQSRSKRLPSGTHFWHKYRANLHVLCLGELRHALMAHSCLGVPGLITLISNLCVTKDFGVKSLEKSHNIPSWLKQYMVGASQEIYELAAFPPALHGQTFRTAAGFIFDTCHAVLLALEGGKGVDKHHLTIAHMNQVIEPSMHGYLVAEDMCAVVLLMGVNDHDFQHWHDHRIAHLQSQQGILQPPPTAVEGSVGPAVTQKDHSRQQPTSSKAGYNWGRLAGKSHLGRARSSESTSSAVMRQSSSRSFDRLYEARKHVGKVVLHTRQATNSSIDSLRGSYNERSPFSNCDKEASLDDAGEWLFQPTQEECDAAASVRGAASAAAFGGQSSGGGDSAGQPAMSASAAAAAAAVAAIASTAGSAPKDKAGHCAALAAVIHLLRSPSKQLQKYGEDFMRQHYQCRAPGTVQCPQDIVVDSVPEQLAGHTLVVGLPRSQEALIALLAPMRSRRLSAWRPIVVVDSKPPGKGACWSMLVQFKHIFYIEMLDGLSDALSRANAEHAAQAILLSPLAANDEETEDEKLASLVMTDAMVISMFQLLRNLNPNMQIITELILPQNMAYLAPMSPLRGVPRQQQSLLSPAFVCGSVFMTRLIDDLMLASYCNNASDRIVLQLLHRWHLSSGSGSLQQQVTQLKQQLEHRSDGGSTDITTQQQQQQHQQRQPRMRQQGNGAVDVEIGFVDQSPDGAQQDPEQQQQQQRAVRFSADTPDQPSGTDAAAANTYPATILQIPVTCAGTTYGRLFHHLLHVRDLLLLGLYRRVMQDGVVFRAAITNPSYSTVLEASDAAFVVTTLPFPASFDDSVATSAATSAAWPPDTLGFNNMNPPPCLAANALDPAPLGMYETLSGHTSHGGEVALPAEEVGVGAASCQQGEAASDSGGLYPYEETEAETDVEGAGLSLGVQQQQKGSLAAVLLRRLLQ